MYEDLDRDAVGCNKGEESKTIFPLQQTKRPHGSGTSSGEDHTDGRKKSTS
jgi:hypothetical protein